jgi:hypothetical protein
VECTILTVLERCKVLQTRAVEGCERLPGRSHWHMCGHCDGVVVTRYTWLKMIWDSCRRQTIVQMPSIN